MNIQEAIEKAQKIVVQGWEEKQIRRMNWKQGDYISVHQYYTTIHFRHERGGKPRKHEWSPTIIDLVCNDWEVLVRSKDADEVK